MFTIVFKGREPYNSDTGIENTLLSIKKKKCYCAEYQTQTARPPRIANVAMVTPQ